MGYDEERDAIQGEGGAGELVSLVERLRPAAKQIAADPDRIDALQAALEQAWLAGGADEAVRAVLSDLVVEDDPKRRAVALALGRGDWQRAARIADALAAKPPASPIVDAWAPMPRAWLEEAPPARRWLLRHPTRDGSPCAPGQGDGLLARGKCGVLVAEGGAGKTMALVQLAISVATGRPWLGHWQAGERGAVLLALAEEDAEEAHRRIYAATRGLEPHELDAVAQRVVVLPLEGREIAIVEADPLTRAVRTTQHHAAMLARLEQGPEDWALVAIDPLARWGSGDVESSNDAATRLVQAVEALAHVRGTPTVLVAHHSSKGSRRAGTVDSRGATALTDGFRWAASLRNVEDRAEFAVLKSNYAIPWTDTLTLLRDRGGALRAATEEELAELEGAAAHQLEVREENAIADLEGQIVAALAASVAPVTSREQLRDLIGGRRALVNRAVTKLLTSGRVVKRPGNGVEPPRYEVGERGNL